MTQLFTDNVDTALSAAANAFDTQIVVLNALNIAAPTGGDFQELTLIHTDGTISETIKVIARSGNVLTLESGLANSFPSGSYVRGTFTAATAERFRTQIKGLKTIAADYTLFLVDAGFFIVVDSANPVTVTIPPEASVDFEVPTFVYLYQKGAGKVMVVPDVGVTINSSALDETASQYSVMALIKVGTDEWVSIGERGS